MYAFLSITRTSSAEFLNKSGAIAANNDSFRFVLLTPKRKKPAAFGMSSGRRREISVSDFCAKYQSSPTGRRPNCAGLSGYFSDFFI